MRLSMAPDQDWAFECVRRWYFRSRRGAPPLGARAAQSAPHHLVLRIRMSLCVLSEVNRQHSGSPCHDGFAPFAPRTALVKLITLEPMPLQVVSKSASTWRAGPSGPGWVAPGGGFDARQLAAVLVLYPVETSSIKGREGILIRRPTRRTGVGH
jgi:hypothetical protein